VALREQLAIALAVRPIVLEPVGFVGLRLRSSSSSSAIAPTIVYQTGSA
jgi:hypothetical protein